MNDAKSRGIVVVGVVVGAADCGEARRQGVRVSCECPTFAESPTVRDKLIYVISDTRYSFKATIMDMKLVVELPSHYGMYPGSTQKKTVNFSMSYCVSSLRERERARASVPTPIGRS